MLHPNRWPSAEGWPGFFDVIVGNPPFESSLTDAGKDIDEALSKTRGALPDKQAAYLFLEQAAKLVNESGRLCLLQPYGLLYNRNSAAFRRDLFRRIYCEEILDFISIRNLFDGADTKTIAIHTRGTTTSRSRNIVHLTFRRTFSATQRIGFELDHYDRHLVPQEVAAENPYVWKANLLGGGRLVEMSARLASMRTLLDVVRSRRWVIGEGFIVGNRKHKADYLNGLPLLPTKAISTDGIAEAKIKTVQETHFERPRQEQLYQPPLMLIKEHSSLPMVFWNKGPLAYHHSVLGIHAPQDQEDELRRFFDFVHGHRKLYQFYSFLNGTRSLIGKATANLRLDIAELPCPQDSRELNLSFWEMILVDDVLDYMAPFVRLGQNSELLRDKASDSHVRLYADMFCRMLGTVYRNLKASDPIETNGLILQPFYFGERPRIEWNMNGRRKQLNQLIYKQQHGSLRTVRVVRIYDENVMLIVKPDRLRYWIRSTAIRDADETLIDLRRQGY